MKNTLKIDFENSRIVMDRTFAKNVQNTNSEEYRHLQQVRRDYPTFAVVARQIKKNPQKETYAGLTYDYMRFYILTHEPAESRKKMLADFEELVLISQCHAKAKRYPVIKNWFLNQYPAIKEFGMPKANETDNNITKIPATTQANEEDFALAG